MKFYFILAGLLFSFFWIRNSQAADIPSVGQLAPNFSLPDQNGKLQQLSDYRGKWVVLYFYPKDGTPGCTTEACSFRDDITQIHAMGAVVLGVSVDDTDSHAQFAQKHHLPFPLLADQHGSVATQYGSLINLMLFKIAKRNTFIINPKGDIAKVYTSVDATNHATLVLSDLSTLTGMPVPPITPAPTSSLPTISQ